MSNSQNSVTSNLLRPDENSDVFNLLGNRRISLATTVVQLHFAQPDPSTWTKNCTGVVCFVKDYPKKSYFLRLIDLQAQQMIWEQELYSQFTYHRPRPFFHTFPGDNYMVGLSFADEQEARFFGDQVENKVQQRQERRSASKDGACRSAGKAPAAPRDPPPPSFTFSRPTPATPKAVESVKKKSKEDKRGKSTKGAKSKFSKLDISGPSNFQHLSHIGWDPVQGFDSNNIAPEWKKLFDHVGVTEEQLKDRDTAQFIFDYVEQHGGIQEAARQIDAQQGGQPPPPPSHGRAPPPPSYSRSAPPPPQPTRGGPLPPPAPSRGRPGPPPPPGGHGAPPPPPAFGGHVPPPLPSGGSAPPPPGPPPPPAPSAPPPPPAPSMGGGGGRGGLLSAIQSGTSLRHVDESSSGGGGGDRGDLLSSIRAGKQLKKVSPNEGSSNASPSSSQQGGMAGALARALADRSKVIHSDPEDDDFEEDDDDWD